MEVFSYNSFVDDLYARLAKDSSLSFAEAVRTSSNLPFAVDALADCTSNEDIYSKIHSHIPKPNQTAWQLDFKTLGIR